MIDFDHGGVSKHLGQIADAMYEWEGPTAEQLKAGVADIKIRHPCELKISHAARKLDVEFFRAQIK